MRVWSAQGIERKKEKSISDSGNFLKFPWLQDRMKRIAFRHSRIRHGFDIGPENPIGLSFDGMIPRKHHTAIMVAAQCAHFDY